MNVLPINLDDIIQSRAVESVRLEFKRSWSEPTLTQIIRTICAFANDFFNLNGGYIVLGIDEVNGIVQLPPHGLDGEDIDEIQKKIRGNSDLVAPGVTIPDIELYRSLKLVKKVNDHEVPRNVALLFFVNDPERYFDSERIRIEVVQFGDDAGGDLIEEKVFKGPIHQQIRQALDYLESFSSAIIKKLPNQAEALRTVTFPYGAMEEALVNAVYHRGYEGGQPPIRVYLYPDRMEITSYPGPVPGIEKHHFQQGSSMPSVPNRNSRIGELLKDLRLAEGRNTGIPKIRRKMKENGSPEPIFDFDPNRTYFRVVLPAHPQYIVIHALRESAHL
jgi:ATP-dependent DNA helicase RecG